MSKNLEEIREQARSEVERLDRLIEIKEFIKQKLTNESGNVIDAHLDFEYGGLKVSIKKARTRGEGSTSERSKSARKSAKKRIKKEVKSLTPSMVKKLGNTSFNGLKKKDAVAKIQESVPSFSDLHWDSFREKFTNALSGKGKGAGVEWTFKP